MTSRRSPFAEAADSFAKSEGAKQGMATTAAAIKAITANAAKDCFIRSADSLGRKTAAYGRLNLQQPVDEKVPPATFTRIAIAQRSAIDADIATPETESPTEDDKPFGG